MPNIIKELNQFSESFNNEESIRALLLKEIEKQRKNTPSRKKYYFLTELCNPTQTYWTTIRTDVIKHPKLARKLALGKQLQFFMTSILNTLPEFTLEEGKVDGFHVGVPGVRGSIDYMLGNKIVELKTKDEIPKDINELFLLYPNDLEQLVFYSYLHPSHPEENYLIFMRDSGKNDFIVFKVITRNFEKVKEIILSRIQLLDEAIEKCDPSKLGKCRYYDKVPKCQFQESNVCTCNKLEPILIEELKSSIEISVDKEFTEQLEKIKTSIKKDDFLFSAKDIIAPRKHFMETIYGLESDWTPDKESTEYYACLSSLIKKLEFHLNSDEIKGLKNSLKDKRLKEGYKWLKLRDSSNPEGEVIPFIIKISQVDDIKNTNRPSFYHKAELGIICSSYNKIKGLMFVVYPKLNDLIKVYMITYKNPRDHFKRIKQAIDDIELSEKEKNLLLLPACPEYMNEDKKCPIYNECHKELGSGCVAGFSINKKR